MVIAISRFRSWYRRWRQPEPLTPQMLAQLRMLGITDDKQLAHWRRTCWDQGVDTVANRLSQWEARSLKFRELWPKLKVYADACRAKEPGPTPDQLTDIEREQQRILRIDIQEFLNSGDGQQIKGLRPDHGVLVTVDRMGLAPAAEFLRDNRYVILTPEESQPWFDEHDPDQKWDWNLTHIWFLFMESPPVEMLDHLRRHSPIAPGHTYWETSVGIQWGDMLGGSRSKAWDWDGKKAVSLGVYLDEQF